LDHGLRYWYCSRAGVAHIKFHEDFWMEMDIVLGIICIVEMHKTKEQQLSAGKRIS
jgi:hypothetical protein